MQRVRFLGVGSFVPRRAVSNARIAAAIPGWSAERIEEKTGIRERRFLWDLDEKTGRAVAPPADDGPFYPANNIYDRESGTGPRTDSGRALEWIEGGDDDSAQ